MNQYEVINHIILLTFTLLFEKALRMIVGARSAINTLPRCQ